MKGIDYVVVRGVYAVVSKNTPEAVPVAVPSRTWRLPVEPTGD